MVSPYETIGGAFSRGAQDMGRLPRDPDMETIHQNDLAVLRAIISNLAQHQGLEFDEYLAKHPEESLETYTLF